LHETYRIVKAITPYSETHIPFLTRGRSHTNIASSPTETWSKISLLRETGLRTLPLVEAEEAVEEDLGEEYPRFRES
jgi:hypothetical protein